MCLGWFCCTEGGGSTAVMSGGELFDFRSLSLGFLHGKHLFICLNFCKCCLYHISIRHIFVHILLYSLSTWHRCCAPSHVALPDPCTPKGTTDAVHVFCAERRTGPPGGHKGKWQQLPAHWSCFVFCACRRALALTLSSYQRTTIMSDPPRDNSVMCTLY